MKHFLEGTFLFRGETPGPEAEEPPQDNLSGRKVTMDGKMKLAIAVAALREKRKQYAKAPITGERIHFDCGLSEPVEYLLYRPQSDQKDLPLFIELHGGAWVANDAVLVDSLCRKIADETPAVVVNLNYKKLDVHPFPYPQEELCAVISHFLGNAASYSIDPRKVVVCGQSAGAHLAAGAAVMGKDKGLSIRHQILVYPFLDFTGAHPGPFPESEEDKEYVQMVRKLILGEMDAGHPYISPLVAPQEALRGIAPATVIVCGPDILRPHGIEYDRLLNQMGIGSTLIDYPHAEHGFLEVNRPDYSDPHPGKSPEQESFSHDCEDRIIRLLQSL